MDQCLQVQQLLYLLALPVSCRAGLKCCIAPLPIACAKSRSSPGFRCYPSHEPSPVTSECKWLSFRVTLCSKALVTALSALKKDLVSITSLPFIDRTSLYFDQDAVFSLRKQLFKLPAAEDRSIRLQFFDPATNGVSFGFPDIPH